MKLVIAEKPMLGRDIARAITGKSVSESARLPISGNGYTVIACAGHLLELRDPAEIDERWANRRNLEALPIEVKNWPKKPAKGKTSLVKEIGALVKQADIVINAGDPDDEGQLIVDELLDYLKYKGPVQRVYVNDNIEKNIRKAFSKLVDNKKCRPDGEAAYARQIADYCFGVNESRLASARLYGNYSIGRVQTPTLGLVVTRDEEIANHVVRKYYELIANGQTDVASQQVPFKFKPNEKLLAGEKKVYDKSILEGVENRVAGKTFEFKTVVGEKTTPPPLPYNLTVLLSEMSRRYKFSAKKTQQITQDLRDKYKAITYNRTDCQYLKEEHYEQAPVVLACAMKNIGVSWKLDYSLHSKAFNDKKITAHHGIIPQESSFPLSRLTADEQKVYVAIVERYAMQFLPPAKYKTSTSAFTTPDGEFSYITNRPLDLGWKATFGKTVDKEEDDTSQGVWIPEGNHNVGNLICTIMEKESKPPAPYTEGTLITDMASIAKYVTDPEVKEILKQKDKGKAGEHGGIGTTATRSNIIETLKKREFIESKGNKIRSTQKGRDFYHLLPDNIKAADTTARWWLIQQDIADGKADVNAVQKDVVRVFKQHKDSAYVGKSVSTANTAEVVGKCPKCGANVIKSGKIYRCESIKSKKNANGEWEETTGCGFKVFPTFLGAKVSTAQVKKLLSGKTVRLKGCKSKKPGAKPFDCEVKLEDSGSLKIVGW